MRLTVDIIPTTCWYSNVRSNVSADTWNTLQLLTFKAANYHCETCGGQGVGHTVECHEIWHYDDHKLIQRLVGLQALCPKCHQVKHAGLAVANGRAKEMITWLVTVNKISPQQALEYLQYAFNVQKIRSQFEWKLDLYYLHAYGVNLDSSGREIGIHQRQ